MGVYDDAFVRPIAEAHARLGTIRALVFHSGDGLDECSIGAPTHVADVRDGEVQEYEIEPGELGLRSASIEELQVRDLEHAAQLVAAILAGEESGPALDMTLINAAAALVAAGRADTFAQGVDLARSTIALGHAAAALDRLRAASGA